MVRRLDLHITPALAHTKTETLLRNHLHLSGTVIRHIKWLEDGILCDGVRVNTQFIPEVGQVLSVRLSDAERSSGILPVCGNITILYEDADLVVICKDAGIPVHPGPGHFDDTIGNFLIYHYDCTGEPADFHPVHRLDRGTSGLLVVAKHPHAQERLKHQFHTSTFRRTYLAICEGTPSPLSGTINVPIGANPHSLMEQMVRPDGKPACTHYHVIQFGKTRSLLELVLDTGRTHQIRVHMSYLGHPLTGDFLYGTENHGLISRPALHSSQLEFFHPITEKQLCFHAPLPQDMLQLLKLP